MRAGVDIILANDNFPHAAATYRRYKDLLASPDTTFLDCSVEDITVFPMRNCFWAAIRASHSQWAASASPQTDPRTTLTSTSAVPE